MIVCSFLHAIWGLVKSPSGRMLLVWFPAIAGFVFPILYDRRTSFGSLYDGFLGPRDRVGL